MGYVRYWQTGQFPSRSLHRMNDAVLVKTGFRLWCFRGISRDDQNKTMIYIGFLRLFMFEWE